MSSNVIKKSWLEDMETKALPMSTQQIEDRQVTGIACVFGNIDDGNDITHLGAFKKTILEGKSRVRHLWQHDFDQPPIATINDLKEIMVDELPNEIKMKFPGVTGGLQVKRTYLDTPRGNEVLYGIRADAINEMSYGYNKTQWDFSKVDGKTVRNLRELRLLDTSDVVWGMNPATVAAKGAIPFKSTPKADESKSWNGTTEFDSADVDTLKITCAWFDVDNADQKSAYKLPHHESTDDHAVVWRGVALSMATLLGAKGGVSIPEGDRKAVYNHLARHYQEFDKEAPDYKISDIFYSYQLARQFIENGINTKEGRIFSAANSEKLKRLIDNLENNLEMLEDMLGIAESDAQESAESASTATITDAAKSFTNTTDLINRIEIAKRKILVL